MAHHPRTGFRHQLLGPDARRAHLGTMIDRNILTRIHLVTGTPDGNQIEKERPSPCPSPIRSLT